MRLGWVVPAPGLLQAIAETKRDDDFGTGVIEQHVLASWLESGHYDQHVRHVQRAYGARRAELGRQQDRYFPGWPQHGAAAGLEILLELPARISERHVVAHARQLGLGVSGLGPMRVTPAGPPGLVLSFARLAPRHCDEIRSRRGGRPPFAVVRGIDSAAASGTTPRVPAQDTTAGTGQDGRRAPLRRWITADSGNTHKILITISVPVTASASAGHAR